MEKRIKKISIITLTYNNWRLLEQAFLSLSTQELPKGVFIEYFVVDDGSIDFNVNAIETMAEQYGIDKKYTFSIKQNSENIGTVASFNRAIKSSNGDLIIPLAGDDSLANDTVIKDITNYFDFNDALLLTGLRIPVVDGVPYKEKVMPECKYHYMFEQSNQASLYKQLCLKNNIISGASTYYHRDVFNIVGMFDESYRLMEDFPFYVSSISKGIKIHLLKKPTLLYSTHGLSNQSTVNPLLQKDHVRLMKNIISQRDFSYYELRCLYFNEVLDSFERKSLFNMIKYIDCLLLRRYGSLKKSIIKRVVSK
ncbi:glycosyltransferase [Agarivorans litoreus]|uniref:glycosyltransferase n=1 Tax=Agarivorans litoreus TaxID=1510455 RepID=UPI001C7DE934|nr:glycosyltransferase [Agarivorans litoreus]